jgi:tetratricopeptide (TPR) repeat protein
MLQSQIEALAIETELREGAVRNIAVELFGARPDLNFDTYAALIESGARELRTYITSARTRSNPDLGLNTLRARAIAAAEDGHLTEARALYDQLIAANRAARERERYAEDLADAADMAEAARLAYVAADFRDAAQRFGEAAALAPQGVHERWLYVMLQAEALRSRGQRFDDVVDLREAVRLYRAALQLFPRATHPDDWAGTQTGLGLALVELAARGDSEALQAAIQAYRAAMEISTRDRDPSNWAGLQGNLGIALTELARRGDDVAAQSAIQAHHSALEVYTRERAPQDWAQTQLNLGVALAWLGAQGDDVALQAAVEAFAPLSKC